jgi:para-aminobenzoate synthetase component 2
MAAPLVLVVDNFDSFVYNLVQYLGELGAEVVVRRNDVVTRDDVARADGVLISPGPGHPRDAGRCAEVIDACASAATALFGVCLGHQALGEAFGGRVVAAPELLHGRASLVEHVGRGLFAGMPNPMVAGRYHSLVVERATLPDCFELTAWTGDLVMGIAHRELPLVGVQFHPESVLTQDGYRLVANWLGGLGLPGAVERAQELNVAFAAVREALPRPSR